MTQRRLLGVFVASVFAGWLFGFTPHVNQSNAWFCPPGEKISYDDAVQEIAAGRIVIDRVVDYGSNRVTVTVTNNTSCDLPVSLASYKMFSPYNPSTLSQQEFFEGTPTYTLTPTTTKALSVGLPDCAASYVLWYGDVVKVQTDNRVYGEFLSGDQVRTDYLCAQTPPPDTSGTTTESTTTPEDSTPVSEATSTPTEASSTPPLATTTTSTATSTDSGATTTPETSTTTPPAVSAPTGGGGGGGGPVGGGGLYVGSGPAASVAPYGGGGQLAQGTFPQTLIGPPVIIPSLPDAGIGPAASILEMFLRWLGIWQ